MRREIQQYAAVLAHQRAFMNENAIRWRSGTVDRRMRTDHRPDYASVLQPDVKF